MRDFIAKRDLSPEKFEIFSRQYKNDLEYHRNRLAYHRTVISSAEKDLEWSLGSINNTKRSMLKHGIEE